MFLMIPQIQMVLNTKISIEEIIHKILGACFHFLAYNMVKKNLAQGKFASFAFNIQQI